MFDGLLFDFFVLLDDGWCFVVVGIGGCYVVQVFVVMLVVVVFDEGFDLGFEVVGQEVVFQQDVVFQGLVLVFDFVLGLGMIWCVVYMVYFLGFDVFSQFVGDVVGVVIVEQFGFVQYCGVIVV